MSEHICHQEKELGALSASVSRFEKEIFGNGKDGLATTVPVLSEKIDTLITTVADLRTAVSGFARFEAGYTAEQSHKTKSYAKALQTIGVVIAFCSLLVAFIVMSHKTTVDVRHMIDQYGYDMTTRGFHLNDTTNAIIQ